MGTSAWHLVKGRRDELVKKSFSMGLWMVLVTSCLQVVIGDNHGLNTREHQPAKLAALEGHWETNHNEPMPLLLFAIPDMKEERNHFEVGVPFEMEIPSVSLHGGVVLNIRQK
ncbi:cytochrome ubiquinol oxidase subunit I [Klebsiella pneumoniae]